MGFSVKLVVSRPQCLVVLLAVRITPAGYPGSALRPLTISNGTSSPHYRPVWLPALLQLQPGIPGFDLGVSCCPSHGRPHSVRSVKPLLQGGYIRTEFIRNGRSRTRANMPAHVLCNINELVCPQSFANIRKWPISNSFTAVTGVRIPLGTPLKLRG